MTWLNLRPWLPLIVLVAVLIGAAVVLVRPGRSDERRRASSDTELRARMAQRLADQPVGEPFALRETLPRGATGMWIFGGYTGHEDITRQVGTAWEGAPDEIPEGTYAIVVRRPGGSATGFMLGGKWPGHLGCMPEWVRLAPTDRLVRLGPVPRAPAGSTVLSRATPRAQRACRQDALAPDPTPGR